MSIWCQYNTVSGQYSSSVCTQNLLLLLACTDEVVVMVTSILVTDNSALTLHRLLYRYGPDTRRQR